MPGEESTDYQEAKMDWPQQNADRLSLPAMLGVQVMNSFSDNLVKMLLIVFSSAVAAKTFLGDTMQACVGVIYALPYIFLAPVAGWVSDRFSKQQVMAWMQAALFCIFLFFAFALWLRLPQVTLALCLVGTLLMATVACFFTPAKLGILKEVVGPKRLGLISGLQQFGMFGATMFAFYVAGEWFGSKLKEGADPWHTGIMIVSGAAALAALQFVVAQFVRRTPDHPHMVWERALMRQHFANVRLVFRAPAIGVAAIGVVFFWFMSNSVLAVLVAWCNEHYPEMAEATRVKSWLAMMLGIGVMSGIMLAMVLNRRHIEVRAVPPAALLMGLALFSTSWIPAHDASINVAVILVGLGAGVFMVPLYAFIQDRSQEHERARVLSGLGLIDCLGSAVANLLVLGLLTIHVPSIPLLVGMAVLCFLTAVGMMKLVRMAHATEQPEGQ